MQSGTAVMNNQRTLDIIREDLMSMGDTCWDNKHPHIFVVMGASVSFKFSLSKPSHLKLFF